MSEHQRPDISELVQEAGISEESLDEECCDSDLSCIARLCDDWQLIAYTIGLSEPQVNAIKEENTTTEVKRIKFLRIWKESILPPQKSTYKVIVNAFLDCQRAKKASKVCKLLAKNQSGGDSSKIQPSGTDLTEEHGAPSRSYSSVMSESENSQSPMNKNVRDSLRALERKFSSVQRQFMKVDHASLEELQSCLATLPSFQSKAPAPLHEATKNDFFHRLKDYCNVQDPEILEDLIEELGDKETKRKLNEFNEELKAFQQRTKLKDMIGNYDGSENMPPNYKELAIKLGDNWREKTLEDLKNVRLRISLTSCLLKLIEDGSLIVTYMVPNNTDLQLSDKHRKYLHQENVEEITMDGKYIFTSKEISDVQSVIESTADNIMELFQTNQEENTRKLNIIGELNKLKDSIEWLSAETVLASKESDIEESVSSELPKSPHVLRKDLSSTHLLGRESDAKPNVGTKRSHIDLQLSHSSPKIPRMPSPPGVPKRELLGRESDAKPKRSHSDPHFGHSSPKIPRMSSTLHVQKKEAPSTHISGKKSDVKPKIGGKRPHFGPQFSHSSPKIARMSSPPGVPKISTHSFGKQSDAKAKVGTKRPHPDPQLSHSLPKISHIINTSPIATPDVIDLTTDSEEDKKSMSKPKQSASNVTEISGHVTGNTTMKTFMDSSSDKTASGYVPELDKSPTSLTTMQTESVKSTKSSKAGVQKERKQPLKRPHASSKVAKQQRSVKPSGKRIRKTRCTEKVKKFCRVCSKPDCGECKNCLKKPIKECITYKAQCKGIKIAVHTTTTQSDSGSISSTLGTDEKTSSETKLQSVLPVTKSRFICRQPPHASHSSSSQQSTSAPNCEPGGVSTTMPVQAGDNGEDFHSQLDETLKEGSVEILIAKCGVFGPPGSGKSHFKALVSGKKRPVGGRQSTALATEAEHIIGNVIDFNEELVEMHRLRDGSKVRWYTTDSKKLSLLIANTLYNHKKPNITIIAQRSMSKTRSEIMKNLMKLLERKLKRKPKCLKKMRLIYLVDTGGQPQFQEVMPIFIRGSSVHFLVHKLNEELVDRPRFDYEINGVKYAVPESMMITNKVYLEQSLRTISSCTFSRTIECRTSSRIPKPHFAVIGMFKDKCESSVIDSKQEAVHKCIQPFTESGNCVAFTPSRHTDKPIYAVDGSEQGWATNEKVIEDLHVNIEKFTESLKVKIPIRWFLFLNLLKDASKDQYFISRAECTALAEKEDIMMDDEDVGNALELFDELNLVLYFPKILPHIVFISPSFLFNKVSEVIVQSFDCVSEDSGATAQERYNYRKTGILDKGLLSRVKSFQQDFGGGFTQDDLFELLTELCIVAKISPSQFFVPCVLALEEDDENSKYLRGIISDMDTAGIERLVISFSDDYSPRGLFCASVAFLAKLPHWEIDSDSSMLKRNLIGFRVREWNRDLTPLGNVVIVDRLLCFEIYTTCDKKHLCDIRRTVSKALWYAAAKCLAYSPKNIDICTGFLCEIACDQPKPHGTRVLDKDDPQWSMKCIKNLSKRSVKLNNKQLPWFSTSDFIDESHAKSDSEPTIDQLVEEFGAETSVTDWQMIALQLDMDQQCVETFEHDEEKGIKECFRKVFTKWKKQLKPPFTWAVIVRALSSSVNEDQHKFADKLKMKYLPY